jgi:hypothetical protein
LDPIERKQASNLRAVIRRLRLHRSNGGCYEEVHAAGDCLVRDFKGVVILFFQRGSLPLFEAGMGRERAEPADGFPIL